VIDMSCSHISCPAHGCPAPATIDAEAGKCCRYHYARDAHEWPAITAALRIHSWLAKLITDVTDRVAHPRPDMGWCEFVHAQGLADADLLPTADEARYAPAYLDRLHHELLWRTGARKERPQPWLRSAVQARAAAAGVRRRA